MSAKSLDLTAAAQHGLFTSRQAGAAGLTAAQVDHGARVGRWHRVHRGVYRMTGVPVTDLQRLLAAVLATGGMASHRGAAWTWNMAGDLRVEVLTAAMRRPPAGVVVHRTRTLPRPVTHRGVPCTNPLRTVVDLASLGDPALVHRALDRGISDGRFTVRAVEAELGRLAASGRAGVTLLRSCLAQRLDGAGGRTSDLEGPMDRLLVRHRIPRPERQHPVKGFRLDYAWPAARLAVEVDGYEPHAGLDAFRHDRARQNRLVLLGWTVLRFTADEVRRRPATVAEQIRTVLGVAATR